MNFEEASSVIVSMTDKRSDIAFIFSAKNNFTKMSMLLLTSLSLILRSAFDYKQSDLLMSGAQRTSFDSKLEKIVGHGIFSLVSKSTVEM